MKVYIHETVRELERFYGDLLYGIEGYATIYDHLEAMAVRMYEGVKSRNTAVFEEIGNYHWAHLGRSNEDLWHLNLGEEDCRQTIANEYGFWRWSEVAQMKAPYDLYFERTVNAVLAGDMQLVKKLVSGNMEVVNQKSAYGHKATLLHYTVSNGVEFWRQKVPMNLPLIVRYLLDSGANKNARMMVYGGEYTASELLFSSAHPRAAGILPQLRKLL